jgi:antitoxin component YwqK of YwqJK toxin-antitoxin module
MTLTPKETIFEDGGKWVDFTNESGQLFKRVSYSIENLIDGVTLYVYDENGDNTAVDIFDGDQERKIHSLKFLYLNHKVVEGSEYDSGGNLLYKTLYEYSTDETGAKVTHQKVYDPSGELISEDISPDF